MIVTAYLGAVIGAGFASGQEIVQFFVNYGANGLKGSVLAGLLFALNGGLLLHLAHKHQISNYQNLLDYLFGPLWSKIVDCLLALFLFLGISTMLSASGAIFLEHLYQPKALGIFIAYILIVLLLVTGKKGLVLSYNLLVPIKILLLLAISIYAAFWLHGYEPALYAKITNFSTPGSWVGSSILYVAYNFSLAMVILTEYQTLTSRRQGVEGALGGGLLLGLLVLVYYLAMIKFLPTISWYEVPMLFVTGQVSLAIKTVYIVILWIGILTTALANAYGFAQRAASLTGVRYQTCLLLCVTLALPISMQSFSALVGKVYPLFGVLGVIILSALIYKSVKEIALELYYKII